MTISEYLQLAVVEAMRFDIEEGNFSDVLLEKLGEDNGKKETDSAQSSTLKDELEKLYKQQKPWLHKKDFAEIIIFLCNLKLYC